jgi:hypothetical protein
VIHGELFIGYVAAEEYLAQLLLVYPACVHTWQYVSEARRVRKADAVVPCGTTARAKIYIHSIAGSDLSDIRIFNFGYAALRFLGGEEQWEERCCGATVFLILHRIKEIFVPSDPALLTVSVANKEFHCGADLRVAAVIEDLVDLVLVVI